MRPPINLIVNADDYGYFPCISRGILTVASSGALTATSVLANSPDLQKQLDCLGVVNGLDLGVHLNLTFGQPLTDNMSEKLAKWGGYFPNAYQMSLLVLNGDINMQDVRAEWRAQIEACAVNNTLSFLNSHEHIHMLPMLFPLIIELAKEYQIPYVRLTQAEWLFPLGLRGIIRNLLMQVMESVNRYRFKVQTPLFLGLGASGRLNYEYLASVFAKLEADKTYELMCHPGFFDPNQISDAGLIKYHDWEAELVLLQSQKLQELYKRFNIRLSNYRDINLCN